LGAVDYLVKPIDFASLEIAELLQLTKRTVDFHVQNTRRKLNVGTRVEAAVKAAIAGLIKP
jgi:DNA-binding CsgD family transcriptional regulator